MATRTISTKLAIEGESEYRAALMSSEQFDRELRYGVAMTITRAMLKQGTRTACS